MKKFKKITCMALAFVMALVLIPATGAAAANSEPVDIAYFPARTLNVSQVAYEGYSHGNQNAIDILPGGDVVAPFDGVIVYTDPNWGYVMLQSREKVLWADGTTYDYMSVGFMHDENISNLWVGKKIDQGVAFYQAGGMGNGNPNAYGDHVHITCHRGKVTRGYPYGNGNVYAYDALSIDPNFTKITNCGKGYSNKWVKLDSYLARCDFYPLNCRVKVTEPTCFKTLPCSKGTNSNSLDIRNGRIGEYVTATGVYCNTYNNYWYRVEVDGRTGFLFSGNTNCPELP